MTEPNIQRTKDDGAPRTRITLARGNLEALSMACQEYAGGDWPDALGHRDALEDAHAAIVEGLQRIKRAERKTLRTKGRTT